MLWLLLKNKMNLTLNGFLKGELSKRRRRLLALAGGTFLFYFLFQWTFEIFNLLYPDGISIINNILSLFFFGFFVFLLASGVTIAVHYLFISSDLQLLMSAPISSSTIFSYKLIESIFANSSFFFFLGVPTFLAYGIVLKAPWVYYPFMVINALIFLTIPISISFLIALFLVRIMPATRAKELTAALMGVVSLGIWLLIQLFRASQFDKHSADFDPERIEQIRLLTQKSIIDFLPSTWAAKSLTGLATLDWSILRADFIPLLSIATLLFLACLILTKRAFHEGLIGSQLDITIKKQKRQPASEDTRPFILHGKFSRSVVGTIFIRDTKLIFRDIRLLTSTLLLVVMMIIFPLIRSEQTIESIYLPFMLIIFFSAFVSIQLTSRLIPFEGKSFWLTILLPQTWHKILWGKFFVGFIFNLISVWLAVAVSCIYFTVPGRVVILAFIISAFITYGISIYGITIGCLFPNFNWDHPKRMLSTGSGLILSLGSLLLVGIWVLVIVAVYSLQPYLNFKEPITDIIIIAISFIMIIFLTVIGLNLSSKKLSQLDWNF